MKNAGMDEAQAGNKIAGRNIKSLQICTWHHPMAESEALKNLLMKVKDKSEKVDLRINIKKN